MKQSLQGKNNGMGYLCLAVLTLAGAVGLQLLCSFVFSMAAGAYAALQFQQSGIRDAGRLEEAVYRYILEHSIWSTVLYHAAETAVFGFLYFKFKKTVRPMREDNREVMMARAVTGILLIGLGMEFFTTAGVGAAYYVLPELIGSYRQDMAAAGLNELTAGSVLASMLFAPVGEELLCRGVIYHLAKKSGCRIFAANCIQALAFGILHFNLVQGVYAFLLGLVLGLLYERYESLYAPVFAHFVINASALLLVPVVLRNVIPSLRACVIIMAAGLFVAAAGALFVGRKKVLSNV